MIESIAIIGAGAFGSALACAGRRAGRTVRIWAREPEVVQSINAGAGNPAFLAGIALEAGIVATGSLADALNGADAILMAVPAQFLRGVAHRMAAAAPAGIPVVSCSKGIERGTCALMHEIIADCLPDARPAVLAGPSFAKEVARGLPTAVTVASADEAAAEAVAQALSHDRFRAFTSNDPVSATIGGAYKNVLGIACGIAIAREMGENARGMLIARGLYEMAQIARAKGGNPANLLGLAGAGDITLTCMGTQSRNTTFGIELGSGRPAAEILAERKVVTEGVHTSASITALGRKLGLHLPIAAAVNAMVNEAAPIATTMAALLTGPTGRELAGLA